MFANIIAKLTEYGAFIMDIKQKKLGIIAGGTSLPQILIEHCRQTNRDFFVLAIENNADRAVFTPIYRINGYESDRQEPASKRLVTKK